MFVIVWGVKTFLWKLKWTYMLKNGLNGFFQRPYQILSMPLIFNSFHCELQFCNLWKLKKSCKSLLKVPSKRKWCVNLGRLLLNVLFRFRKPFNRCWRVGNRNVSSNGESHQSAHLESTRILMVIKNTSTVSGTDEQEGRHAMQQSMSSQVKTNTNLIRTALLPIIYTPAQLHENNTVYQLEPKMCLH